MNNIVHDIIGAIISISADYYIWSNLLNKKIDFKKIKTYIIFALLMWIIILNYYFVNDFLKVILLTVIFMPCVYLLFNEDINKSIITPIFSQLIFIVSEIIFAIFLMLLNIFTSVNIIEKYSGSLIMNLLITLLAICISKLNVTRKIYRIINKISKKIKHSIILPILISLIIIISTVYGLFYHTDSIVIIFFTDAILCFLYAFFILKIMADKYKYIKVYDKYNMTLDSLREYEDILNKYRISNHENKNQLLMIRNMSKNKKIINYIDEIIDNKIKDNDKLMLDVLVIPEGGLRGLIYSKLLYMKDKNIKGKLSVDKKVRTVDLINMNNSLMLDICKIIGVFIDNAIDEVIKLKEKNIEIAIFFEEDYLVVSVSNNYKNIIEMENIGKSGYTTKGSGHGYGLSLVKEIIQNNKKLINQRRISKNVFTQILKIKM